jgi:hypothetical protein
MTSVEGRATVFLTGRGRPRPCPSPEPNGVGWGCTRANARSARDGEKRRLRSRSLRSHVEGITATQVPEPDAGSAHVPPLGKVEAGPYPLVDRGTARIGLVGRQLDRSRSRRSTRSWVLGVEGDRRFVLLDGRRITHVPGWRPFRRTSQGTGEVGSVYVVPGAAGTRTPVVRRRRRGVSTLVQRR